MVRTMLKLLGARHKFLPTDRAVHESGSSAHLTQLVPGGLMRTVFACLLLALLHSHYATPVSSWNSPLTNSPLMMIVTMANIQ